MTPHPKTGAPSLPRPQNGRASWLIARRFSSFGKKRGVLAERGGNRIASRHGLLPRQVRMGVFCRTRPAPSLPPSERGVARSAGGSTPCTARPAPFAASRLRASHTPRHVPHGVLPQSRFARQPPLGGGLCQVAEQEVAPVKSEGSRGSTFRPVVLLLSCCPCVERRDGANRNPLFPQPASCARSAKPVQHLRVAPLLRVWKGTRTSAA